MDTKIWILFLDAPFKSVGQEKKNIFFLLRCSGYGIFPVWDSAVRASHMGVSGLCYTRE